MSVNQLFRRSAHPHAPRKELDTPGNWYYPRSVFGASALLMAFFLSLPHAPGHRGAPATSMGRTASAQESTSSLVWLPSLHADASIGADVTPPTSISPCLPTSNETILFCDDFDTPAIQHTTGLRPVKIDDVKTRWQGLSGLWDSSQFVHGCEYQYYTLYGVDYSTAGSENYANPSHQTNFVHNYVSDHLGLVLQSEPGTMGFIPDWMQEPGSSCWMNWTLDSSPPEPMNNYVQDFEYTSGWLESTMYFKYGRFEIRARIPNEGRVAWPAFWLFGGTHYDNGSSLYGEDSTEIDIFEFTGYEANRFTRNLHNYFSYSHWTSLYGQPEDHQHLEECTDDSWTPTCNYHRDVDEDKMVIHHYHDQKLGFEVGQWHTYAVEWRPQSLTWYIDDKQVGSSIHRDVPSNHMSMIVNLALPDWLSDGINRGVVNGNDTSLSLPASFDIDYVKVTAVEEEQFTPTWTNGGTGAIDTFALNPEDEHLAGDFTGNGVDELLSIAPSLGSARLLRFSEATLGKGPWEWTFSSPGWATIWSNNDSGAVQSWQLDGADRFLVGDFVKETTAARDELLAISGSNAVRLLRFENGDWSSVWHSPGPGSFGSWDLKSGDIMVAADLDGVEGDELLVVRESMDGASIFVWDTAAFKSVFNATGAQLKMWGMASAEDILPGDFDGDGADELMTVNRELGLAHLLAYAPIEARFNKDWTNDGSGKVHWWYLNFPDRFTVGDFAASPGDEFVAYNPSNGWSQLLVFDGAFQTVWGNDGHGRVHNPNHLGSGGFSVAGLDMLLSVDDRHWAYLETFRRPGEVLSFAQ